MKVKERQSWALHNEGNGLGRASYDQFNKSFKGQERNPKAKEYASMGLEEYHHYSERAEYKEDDENSKLKKKDNSSSNSKRLKNLIGRTVAVAASSVILVTTYVSMTSVSSNNWVWSSDMETAIVELMSNDGDVLRKLPADITVTQEDANCNQSGLKTYVATALDENEEVYTDTRYETISPLGHDHHLIEQRSENGQIIMVYECSRCHESFTITIDLEEGD